MKNDCILGIDTSNYRTSIAVVSNDGTIQIDKRKLLRVKNGKRGLRQSEALFQHVENLPELFEKLNEQKLNIKAVAVSNKPRPLHGSYMPCFKAGYGFGKAIANTLNVPLFQFSHQEGHLEAIKYYSGIKNTEKFLAWHLSGGTCELLKISNREIEIVGGSKDISFGQVIDRIGVLLGMNFPAGQEMDSRALRAELSKEKRNKQLTKIKLDELFFNLSGIETQCNRLLQNNVREHDEIEENFLIKELFDKISETIISVSEKAIREFEIKDVLFVGGVSSSQYISKQIIASFEKRHVGIEFGRQELSGDNAVGIALLGGKNIWQ